MAVISHGFINDIKEIKMNINDSVESLKGIGPKTSALFSKLNINSIDDLLRFYPRNYLSYGETKDISDTSVGERVAIEASVESYVDIKKIRKLTLVTCMVKDGTGTVKLVWYNSPFLKQVFHIGQSFVFVGNITLRNNQLTMEHPEYYTHEQYEKIKTFMQPVYPLTAGLNNKTVTKSVKAALPLISQMVDLIPREIIDRFDLLPLDDAVKGVHFPRNFDNMLECRNRLVFDEFFFYFTFL